MTSFTKKSVATKALEKLVKQSKTKKDEDQEVVEYDPAKQAEGLKERIEGSGIDVEKKLDKRNFVEKALNLTPDQNFLFDIFEVINRPQQAIFGAIKSVQEGGDFFQGAWEGLSGDRQTSFSHILNETGLGDAESFGVDDVIGFIGDVFLDPIDLALIVAAPFTGGATAAITFADNVVDTANSAKKGLEAADSALKAARAAGNATDIAKAQKTYNKMVKAVDKTSKNISKMADLKKAANGVIDAQKSLEVANLAGKASEITSAKNLVKDTNKLYQEALKPLMVRKTPLEMAFRGTKRAITGTIKATDNVVVKVLDKIDGQRIANPQFMDQFAKASDYVKMADRYKDVRLKVKSIFDATATLPKDLVRALREGKGKAVRGQEEIMVLGEKAINDLKDISKKLNLSEDQAAKMVQDLFEEGYKPQSAFTELFLSPRGGVNEATRGQMVDFLNKYVVDEKGQRIFGEETVNALFKEHVDVDGLKRYFIDDTVGGSMVDEMDKIVTRQDKAKIALEEQVRKGRNSIRRAHRVDKTTYDLRDAPVRATQAQLDDIVTESTIITKATPENVEKYIKANNNGGTIVGGNIVEYPDGFTVARKDGKIFKTDEEALEYLRKNNIDTYGYYKDPADGTIFIDDDIVTVRSPEAAYWIGDKGKQRSFFDWKTRTVSELDETVSKYKLQLGGRKLMSTKASNDVVETIYKTVDKNLIDGVTGAGKKLDNENILELVTKQKERLRIKKRAKGLSPKNITKIDDQIASLDRVAKTVKESRKSLSSKVKPFLNPDRYYESALRKSAPAEYMEAVMERTIDAPRFYSEADKAYIQSIKDNYPELKQYTDSFQGTLNQMYDTMDETLGTDFGSMKNGRIIRHTLTQEAQEIIGVNKIFDMKMTNRFKGRVKDFQLREWKMSALEANKSFKETARYLIDNKLVSPEQTELLKKVDTVKMFESEITKSLSDFIVKGQQSGQNARVFDTIVSHSVFSNPDLVTPIYKGTSGKVTQTTVNKSEIVKKLEGMRKYIKDPTFVDETIKTLETLGTEMVAIDNNILDLIGRSTSKTETNMFYQMLRGVNNIFKKFSLLTPGFHLRNLTGNYTNVYLSGVKMGEYNNEIVNAINSVKKGRDVFKRATVEGIDALSSADKVIYNTYKDFIESGFYNVSYELFDLPDLVEKGFTGKKKLDKNIIGKFIEKNADYNNAADSMYRLALLEYAKKNPEIYIKRGLQTPTDLVRLVLFDPNDLSKTEQIYLKQLVPFYTFMKKNLVYQMQNLFEQPNKYNKVAKAVRSAWSAQGIDQDDVERYKTENFWIPAIKKKNGEYVAIKLNLPIGDLGEFLDNPLQKVLASTTPAIRAPFEIATNTQTYTGLPIEEFSGQRGYRIPEIGRQAEYALGQTGLLNPLSGIMDFVRTASGGQEFAPQNVLGSVFGRGSTDREQRNRGYKELEELRDMMKYYKQEGIKIKTLDEIRAEQALRSSRTSQILQQLSQIGR